MIQSRPRGGANDPVADLTVPGSIFRSLCSRNMFLDFHNFAAFRTLEPMEIVVTMPAIFCHMFMVILFRILNRHGIAVDSFLKRNGRCIDRHPVFFPGFSGHIAGNILAFSTVHASEYSHTVITLVPLKFRSLIAVANGIQDFLFHDHFTAVRTVRAFRCTIFRADRIFRRICDFGVTLGGDLFLLYQYRAAVGAAESDLTVFGAGLGDIGAGGDTVVMAVLVHDTLGQDAADICIIVDAGIDVEGSGGQTVVHLGVSTGNAVAAVPSQDAMVSALKNTLKLTSIAIARTRADNLLSHLSIRLHVQLTFLY